MLTVGCFLLMLFPLPCSHLSATGTPVYKMHGSCLSPKVSTAENFQNLRHPAQNEPVEATNSSLILEAEKLKQDCVGSREGQRSLSARLEYMEVACSEQRAGSEIVIM